MRLSCPQCGTNTLCDLAEMQTRLRAAGKLRRAAEPEPQLVCELFTATAASFRCAECGQVGLHASPASDDGDDDWLSARTCHSCGEPISAERIEVFPDATLCAACQKREEKGEDDSEPEFCPKCGAIMVLQQKASGGISRYVMTCPECR